MRLTIQYRIGNCLEALNYPAFRAIKGVPYEAALTDILTLERNLIHCALFSHLTCASRLPGSESHAG